MDLAVGDFDTAGESFFRRLFEFGIPTRRLPAEKIGLIHSSRLNRRCCTPRGRFSYWERWAGRVLIMHGPT